MWLNGHYVGQHENGITAFGFDLTPYIKYNKENRLEVLKKQLTTEKQRLASSLADNGKPLSALVTEFQMLTTEEGFAQKQLTSAMTSSTDICFQQTSPVVARCGSGDCDSGL